MASLKSSIRKAQNPSLCHLCEESPSIQWKCVDCSLLMCSKCKTKVHSKFKSAGDHNVISLKDIGNKQIFKLDLQNISCKIHKGKKYCLYCKNCQKLACPNCVSDTHTKHDLESLEKIYEKNVDKVKYFRDELEADLSYFVEDAKKLENLHSSERNRYENTKQAIRRQAEEFKKAVDKETARCLQNLDTNWIEVDGSSSSDETTNLRSQQAIQSTLSSLDTTLNGDDIEKLIDMENSFPALWGKIDKPIRKECRNLKEFFPGHIDENQISKMLGSLQIIPEPEKEFSIVKSFKTDFGIVSGLHPCKDGHVLMYDGTHALSLAKMKYDENRINKTMLWKDIRIFDIVEIEKNEFIVSFVDQTALKCLHPDGSFEDFLDLSPLLPRALHLTQSGKLLVSVREQGEVFPATSVSQRKLIVMDRCGKQIHEYDRDDRNERLFSMVIRVTTGKNNDIYLIDHTSFSGEGTVTALTYPNRVLWKYNGHESINSDSSKPFTPCGIVTTDKGNIIVTDKDNSMLHILCAEGVSERFIDIESHGIMFPFSLAISLEGLIWIGCTKMKEDPNEVMLHIAKFTGF